MKKNLFKLLSVVVVISMALAVLAACNREYKLPSDLELSVAVYNGETLLGTITKDSLKNVKQEKISMETTNSVGETSSRVYIAYSVSAILEANNITVPAFTKIETLATDNAKSEFTMSDFEKSYITVGVEENGRFAADIRVSSSGAESVATPRLITNRDAMTSNTVVRNLSRITVNPPAPAPPPPPVDGEYSIPESFSIDVYDGDTKVATINKTLLDGVDFEIITIDTRNWVAFPVASVLEELVSDFTNIRVVSSNSAGTGTELPVSFGMTNFDKTYVTIGYYETDPATLITGGVPRLIVNKETATNGNILQRVLSITVNPSIA